jgi:hypothetical protein
MYCKECRFWERDGADGICRKEHPKPLIAMNAVYSIIWPRTRSDEWCGSFENFIKKDIDETQRNYT